MFANRARLKLFFQWSKKVLHCVGRSEIMNHLNATGQQMSQQAKNLLNRASLARHVSAHQAYWKDKAREQAARIFSS